MYVFKRERERERGNNDGLCPAQKDTEENGIALEPIFGTTVVVYFFSSLRLFLLVFSLLLSSFGYEDHRSNEPINAGSVSE